MAKSVGTKGNPFESSKPFCVKERWLRRPLTQNAASWTRCKAMRGQIVCPPLWLQAQMLRRQEPDSDLVAGNLIGQQLANRSLKAGRIARLSALFASGPLGLDLLGHAFRATGVEFFFANQSR